MPRLNDPLKALVIRQYLNSKRTLEILKFLKEEENSTIDQNNLVRFIQRFQQTKSFQNQPLPGHPAKNTTPDVLDFNDKKMEANDEATSTTLQRLLPD